jgi:hypothetical protein
MQVNEAGQQMGVDQLAALTVRLATPVPRSSVILAEWSAIRK